jgi:hypothetical protein
MSYHYSNPDREHDPHALPDVEVFEMTAREVAETDEDLIREYMKRHEFRLAGFNSRDREKMFDAMIEEEGIEGGFYFHFCFPGCLPESDFPTGPFKTRKEAAAAAEEMACGD